MCKTKRILVQVLVSKIQRIKNATQYFMDPVA